MTLTYDLKRMDLLASDWLLFTRSPQLAWLRWVPFVMLIVPALGRIPFDDRCGCPPAHVDLWDWLIAFGAGLAIPGALLGLCVLTALWHRDNDGTVGRHTLTLTVDGWVDSTATGELRRTWLEVDDVCVFPSLVYMRHSLQRLIIPRRAFAQDRDLEEAASLIRAHWRRSTGPHAVDTRFIARSEAPPTR